MHVYTTIQYSITHLLNASVSHLFYWHREMSCCLVLSVSVSQTAPCWNPNKSNPTPPTCTSTSIKILFIISVHHIGKAANNKLNNIVKLSKQRWCECWLWSSGTNCLTKAAFLFFCSFFLFFGLKSSALDWSKPSGHGLRCIQNFNVPFSIV